MTGWRRFLEGRLGDLDALFPYRSPRTVLIKDCRLGLGLVAAQLAILGYVIGYQLVYSQTYQVAGDVVAFSRLQLQRPETAFRYPDGTAPYCVNGTGGAGGQGRGASYVVDAARGTYEYTGDGGGGVLVPQQPCVMMDDLYAVPNSLEKEAILLTTRLTLTQEAAAPAAQCSPVVNREFCEFANTSAPSDFFTADAEFFTLLVDHSMYAPDAGITRTVRQMKGSMRVRSGPGSAGGNIIPGAESRQDRDSYAPTIDPCSAYADAGFSCPPYVNVGQIGESDIFPIKTLLQAAGITTLDQASGYDPTTTMRHTGVVLILEVEYSNYFRDTRSWSPDAVSYTYWVTAVPGSQYKAESAATASSDALSGPAPPTRTVYNRHGVRVVLSFSGRIGSFNFQAFLINLFVSFGLLGAANFLMEMLVFFSPALRLRRVYRQYKERVTVDFGDVLRSGKADRRALAELLARFEAEEDLVDPAPAVFDPILRGSSSGEGGAGGRVATNPLSTAVAMSPVSSTAPAMATGSAAAGGGARAGAGAGVVSEWAGGRR